MSFCQYTRHAALSGILAVSGLGACAAPPAADTPTPVPVPAAVPAAEAAMGPGLGAVAAPPVAPPQRIPTAAEAAAEAQVKARADARWQALVKRDFDAAYPFATPAFRAKTTMDAYRGQFGNVVTLMDAKVFSVLCAEQECTVVIDAKARPLLPGRSSVPIATALEEVWVLEDGQWWFSKIK